MKREVWAESGRERDCRSAAGDAAGVAGAAAAASYYQRVSEHVPVFALLSIVCISSACDPASWLVVTIVATHTHMRAGPSHNTQ